MGTADDIACFHRFIGSRVDLGVADAIVYARCRDLIRMAGDFEANFVALTHVANNGHFLGQVYPVLRPLLTCKNLHIIGSRLLMLYRV